jgi:hypothetical protein
MEWVGDSLKQLRIRPDPDRPDSEPAGIFRISEVVLLVPVDEQFDGHAGEDHGYGEAPRSPRATVFGMYAVWPVRIRDTLKIFIKDIFYGLVESRSSAVTEVPFSLPAHRTGFGGHNASVVTGLLPST